MIESKTVVDAEDHINVLQKIVQSKFYKRASKYDETYSFPKENFTDLHKHGLLTATVGEEFDGMGLACENGNIRSLWKMTTEIAKADMSTSRCWEGHNNAMMMINSLGTYTQKQRWFLEVQNEGALWSVWSGEPLLKTPNQSRKIGTTVTKTKDGYLVKGSKVFCSSAAGASWAILLVNTEGSGGARHADGSPESVIMLACDLSDAKVTMDDSWWKPIGMRGSVSYFVHFDNVLIPFENEIGTPGEFLRNEWQTRWTPQYAATFLGAAEASYDYAKEHVISQNRHDDPYIQHRIARMALNIRSANMWLDQVAYLWKNGDEDEAKSTGNMVRYQVEQLVADTLENAIHICGARGLIQPSPLERIMRDFTLYARHDNDDQLLATIGKSLLGEEHDRSFFNSKKA